MRGIFILIYIKHRFFFLFLSQLPLAMSGNVNNEHVLEFADSIANGRGCRNVNTF